MCVWGGGGGEADLIKKSRFSFENACNVYAIQSKALFISIYNGDNCFQKRWHNFVHSLAYYGREIIYKIYQL